MTVAAAVPTSQAVNNAAHVDAYFRLLLGESSYGPAVDYIRRLTADEKAAFLKLANAHHVPVRVLARLRAVASGDAGAELDEWISQSLATEEAKIANALTHLSAICAEIEAAGCSVTVMKSLDHTPDIGNDLDLYTTGDPDVVLPLLHRRFGATLKTRSWGDRLANKWNFVVPGLAKPLEVHVRRMGQTGEHTELARRFATRKVRFSTRGYQFWVPAPEERVIAATLQRMYRHFYIRACDIVNTAQTVERGELDYDELRRAAAIGSIWPGVATFLNITSDYVSRYRGRPLELPPQVRSGARFGGERIRVIGRSLHVPVMPEGASLYGLQLSGTARRGDFNALARLSLLPPLASVAAMSLKLTGSNKRIW